MNIGAERRAECVNICYVHMCMNDGGVDGNRVVVVVGKSDVCGSFALARSLPLIGCLAGSMMMLRFAIHSLSLNA